MTATASSNKLSNRFVSVFIAIATITAASASMSACNTVEEKPVKAKIDMQPALRTDDSSVCHGALQKVASGLLGVKAHLSEDVFMTMPNLTVSNAPAASAAGTSAAKNAGVVQYTLNLKTPGEGLCIMVDDKGRSGSVPYCECRGI